MGPLEVGAHTLFRRRTSQRHRHDGCRHYVYASWHGGHRDCTLHVVAQPAVGVEVPVESFRGPLQDQTLVGTVHAAAHSSLAGWRSLHVERLVLVPRHHVLLLPHGLQQCYARHSGRRFLYDRTRQSRPGMVCRHPKHVLSHSRHFRTRRAGGTCRNATGDVSQPKSIHLEPRFLWFSRSIPGPLALSWCYDAAAKRP